MTKYIFFTGGVVSSLGKGLTAASLGKLLQSRGLKIGIIRLDPYFNPDPSTMNPYQHGEVFVTNDGAETDLALGHYERFMNINLTEQSCTTLGRIYRHILDQEREGVFGGSTVQVVPHVTNECKNVILAGPSDEEFDIVIVEIGGTVGDMECHAFLETIRQVRQDVGRKNTLFVHVALVPYLHKAEEPKTKPVQHSVKTLRSIGIQPDIIVCRTEVLLDESATDKIALFCDIDKDAVIQRLDTDNIYDIPMDLYEQKMDQIVIDKLNLDCGEADVASWESFYNKSIADLKPVKIALVGKYTSLPDAYLSVTEALRHCAINEGLQAEIKMIAAQDLTSENVEATLGYADGIIIPDGFGVRGSEGMMLAAKYGRQSQKPTFAIGMGMHTAVVEFARNVAGIKNAGIPETENADETVIFATRTAGEQQGGSLECGLKDISLMHHTKIFDIYNSDMIKERHRHRYSLDVAYKKVLEDAGMVFSGYCADGEIVEAMELPEHPWFVACQFRPEFLSRPEYPHPLYTSFVKSL